MYGLIPLTPVSAAGGRDENFSTVSRFVMFHRCHWAGDWCAFGVICVLAKVYLWEIIDDVCDCIDVALV